MQRIRNIALIVFATAACAAGVFAQPQMSDSYTAEVHKVIYPSPAVAPAEIRHAIATATSQHKNVILDFGGNWCGDCKVLDYYFHQYPNAGLLAHHYILVDINIGEYNANLDLAKKYNIPLRKGVPALAVLNSHGHLLYSQTGGQFENMRHMSPNSVTAFLNKWKPSR